MTLRTVVALRNGNPRALFMHLRELIGTPADTPIREGAGEGEPFSWISNPLGIGLPGILEVRYAPDGPMLDVPESWTDLNGVTHQEDADEVASDPTRNGWAAMETAFDTAYGYRADNGAGCSDLHAWFVQAVAAWADERGIDWQWRNEYTGEWHHRDRQPAIEDFGDARIGDPRTGASA